VSAQEATPSAADAAKRADLVRRLGNIIADGVAGYTGLRAEVLKTAFSSLALHHNPHPMLASALALVLTCCPPQTLVSVRLHRFSTCSQAYGSYVSGFYTPSGDLDVTIEGTLDGRKQATPEPR
jgi:hypothetical protein